MTLLIISGCGSEPENISYSFQTLTSDGEWQEMLLVHGYTSNLEACNNLIKSAPTALDGEEKREFRCVELEDKPVATKKEGAVKPDSDGDNAFLTFLGYVFLVVLIVGCGIVMSIFWPVLIVVFVLIIASWIFTGSLFGFL